MCIVTDNDDITKVSQPSFVFAVYTCLWRNMMMQTEARTDIFHKSIDLGTAVKCLCSCYCYKINIQMACSDTVAESKQQIKCNSTVVTVIRCTSEVIHASDQP